MVATTCNAGANDKSHLKSTLATCLGVSVTSDPDYLADDHVCALTYAGVEGWSDLVSLSKEDILSLTTDGNTSLQLIKKRKLACLVAYYHITSCEMNGPLDPTSITKARFMTGSKLVNTDWNKK